MCGWKTRRQLAKIRQGAVFAYPTDTIWGLGCHPQLASSVARLLQIKQRSANKGLILLSASVEFLTPYVDDNDIDRLRQLQTESASHPISWICRSNPDCPQYLSGQHDSIAVRITQCEPVRALSTGLQSPLVSTSANISGRSPIRNALQAHKQFAHLVDFIVEGHPTRVARASQIRDLNSGRVIRN